MAQAASPSLWKLLRRSGLFAPGLMLLVMSAFVFAFGVAENPPPALHEYIEILNAGKAQATVVRKTEEEGPRGTRQLRHGAAGQRLVDA